MADLDGEHDDDEVADLDVRRGWRRGGRLARWTEVADLESEHDDDEVADLDGDLGGEVDIGGRPGRRA